MKQSYQTVAISNAMSNAELNTYSFKYFFILFSAICNLFLKSIKTYNQNYASPLFYTKTYGDDLKISR